jgi:bZIP transcription factor
MSFYDDLDLFDIQSETTNSCQQFPCKHPRDDESFFIPGTEEYKKARKRRQNRESAVRIRARKKLDEIHVFTSLESLKENTGKLKVENSHLKSENDTLKKQIAMLKKLASNKTEENQPEIDKKPEEIKGNVIGKGKNIAGIGLAITILCIIGLLNIENSQPINTGGRSLAFSDSGLDTKPIMIGILVILSGFLLNILIFKI